MYKKYLPKKLPSNLTENSHMHVSNAGFTTKDAKEIRFYCTEIFKGLKSYWHFKTNDDNIIQTALNGDQTGLRIESLRNSYTELNPPHEISGIYGKRFIASMAEGIDYLGRETNGGFTTTPFGSYKNMAFWTIRGPNAQQPVYECASYHRYVGGFSNSEDSPKIAETHHAIWFRGDPPGEDIVHARLLSRT
jgi:hypothetical protein